MIDLFTQPVQRNQNSRHLSQNHANQRASYVRSLSPSSAQKQSSTVHADAVVQNGQHPAASKNAGFKPIGQASSAVKMFFPTDDDEAERRPSPAQSGPANPVQTPIVDHGFHPQSRASGSASQELERGPLRLTAEVRDHVTRDVPSRPQDSPQRPTDAEIPIRHGDEAVSAEATPMANNQTPIAERAELTSPHTEGIRGELYAIISQVGEGTFGKVYKARNTVTRVYVALKRIRMESERDGFPVTAMREIKLLQSLRHQNIVRLYEMMVSSGTSSACSNYFKYSPCSEGSVYMVFEYMDHDLTGVLSQTQFQFTDAHLKSLCHQMLAGLAYLHHKGVIHRDIKGSNILLNNRGELKLGDFGLARFYQKRRRTDYTNRVITLWYRPPELLFGATVYGPEVDMWSAGYVITDICWTAILTDTL